MKKNEIAAVLERNIDKIVEDWVTAVHDNRGIQSSEDLSEGGLRDHVPQVLEEIVALLRTDDAPNISNTRDARVAAYTRYTQNYRISELIIEIALLRHIIFNYLNDGIADQKVISEISEYHYVTTIINSYLDEEMRYGSSIFCERLKESEND